MPSKFSLEPHAPWKSWRLRLRSSNHTRFSTYQSCMLHSPHKKHITTHHPKHKTHMVYYNNISPKLFTTLNVSSLRDNLVLARKNLPSIPSSPSEKSIYYAHVPSIYMSKHSLSPELPDHSSNSNDTS